MEEEKEQGERKRSEALMSAVKVHLGCTAMLSDATIHICMCIQAHTYGPGGCRLLEV